MIDHNSATAITTIDSLEPSPQPPRSSHSLEALAPRVLVVDDEESIRRAIGKFLRSRGFDVVTADSGVEALEQLAQQSFVLMLCDVRMPGLTGLEVVPRALQLDGQLAIM